MGKKSKHCLALRRRPPASSRRDSRAAGFRRWGDQLHVSRSVSCRSINEVQVKPSARRELFFSGVRVMGRASADLTGLQRGALACERCRTVTDHLLVMSATKPIADNTSLQKTSALSHIVTDCRTAPTYALIEYEAVSEVVLRVCMDATMPARPAAQLHQRRNRRIHLARPSRPQVAIDLASSQLAKQGLAHASLSLSNALRILRVRGRPPPGNVSTKLQASLR